MYIMYIMYIYIYSHVVSPTINYPQSPLFYHLGCVLYQEDPFHILSFGDPKSVVWEARQTGFIALFTARAEKSMGLSENGVYHKLVGGFNPSEKYGFVSWDDDIPNIWKVIKAMFQTTNQQNGNLKYLDKPLYFGASYLPTNTYWNTSKLYWVWTCDIRGGGQKTSRMW